MMNDFNIIIKQQCWNDPQRILQKLFHNRPITPTHDGWRIGNKGSIGVRKDGCWYCFESGVGGDIIDLISYALAVDCKGAFAYARAFVGQYDISQKPLHLPTPLHKKNRAEKIAKAQAIWANAQPLNGDVYDDYLAASRGLVLSSYPDDLRASASAYNFTTGKYHPAMIAAVRDKAGDIIGIHQTFLTPEGQKISGVGVKAKLFVGAVAGGAIRLAPVQDRAAICEGIENSLSIMQMLKIPAWASGTASNIPELPNSIREVIIGQDNDPAGVKYAQKMAQYYLAEGRQVEIIKPPAAYKDFNNLIQKKASV
jgi:hypothetical protein